ncbi:MAG: Wadjet anti-phage system protein JetD domain-containing protein [Verrucomicrobiota bacterium]
MYSPVLQTLVAQYTRSKAGRTGAVDRDWLMDFRALLRLAGCEDGEARVQAVCDLEMAERKGVIQVERHRRDRELIERIRLPLAQEAALFTLLGLLSPTHRRQEFSRQFALARYAAVPEPWRERWQTFCREYELAALQGTVTTPFSCDDPAGNAELLELLPKLLAWPGESLLRFASCVLCQDSKRLEQLSGRLAAALQQLSHGEIASLDDLGLVENPRTVLLHGPLRLDLRGQWLDLGRLRGASRISQMDIEAAALVEINARRCITIENETSFHELAKLQCGDLLIQTSYPGSGTRALLQRLPDVLEYWHFGDADADGFAILNQLRTITGKPFRSLHMRFRAEPCGPKLLPDDLRKLQKMIKSDSLGPERVELEAMLAAGHKGAFEQESLGRPVLAQFPFYAVAEVHLRELI